MANLPIGRELLQKVARERLPPMPSTTQRLCLDLSAEESSDPHLLIETLQAEKHLQYGLLSLANSPLQSGSSRFVSTEQVVSSLGHLRTCELLWVLTLSDALQTGGDMHPRVRDRLWRHSLLVSVLSETLFKLVGLNDQKFGLACGLAHDFGHMLLVDVARPGIRWHTENDQLADCHSVLPVERDHCRLGASLLQLWNAPAELVRVSLHHHDPSMAAFAYDPLIRVVRLADMTAEYLDRERSASPLRLESTAVWDGLVDRMGWQDVPRIDQLTIEALPKVLLTVDDLANVLAR